MTANLRQDPRLKRSLSERIFKREELIAVKEDTFCQLSHGEVTKERSAVRDSQATTA